MVPDKLEFYFFFASHEGEKQMQENMRRHIQLKAEVVDLPSCKLWFCSSNKMCNIVSITKYMDMPLLRTTFEPIIQCCTIPGKRNKANEYLNLTRIYSC